MNAESEPNDSTAAADPVPKSSGRATRRRPGLLVILSLFGAYLAVVYGIIPLFWRPQADGRNALSDAPRITRIASGIAADPVNCALVGSEEEVLRALTLAEWQPANSDTARRLAAGVAVQRPEGWEPAGDQFLQQRKQDLAFENSVGDLGGPRYFLRLWRWTKLEKGRPLWIGSATYVTRSERSEGTGLVKHRTGPDVDSARNRLGRGLEKAGAAQPTDMRPIFHKVLEGRNANWDPWTTDGKIAVITLIPSSAATHAPAGSPAAR